MAEAHPVSPQAAEELARHVRETRAWLSEAVANAYQRVGETQHATEEQMHRVADRLPDPELVHRRARQLSERADEHLDRAERERATADADTPGPEPR